jgi:hypothetical protein
LFDPEYLRGLRRAQGNLPSAEPDTEPEESFFAP